MSSSSDVAVEGVEGPLAEFAALRVEIQERVKAQQQMLSFQLTFTGAVFGFAITRPGMTALLLIVPFGSYLLCARLVAQHFGTLRVAMYIKDELSGRVPGGLGWERWLESRQRRRPHFMGSTLPLLFTFAGASVLALGWTTGYVFGRHGVQTLARFGLGAFWVLGVAAALSCVVFVLQMNNRLPVRSWAQTGLS
ncbi:hypothetical protein [Saccharothrix lopnurensis]|uniref:Sensor protein n=1 Tax=Saccharothrix lopnurensis TaxID=1670621 RepID=A0ABW1P865_9PSEU